MDGAVFLDVDVGARFLLDAADDLAAGTDDVADFVDGNVDGLDARRGVAELGTGLGQLLEHGAQDERAAFVCLLERAGEDVDGQALRLVVHLKCGDALRRAADLEVHVAEEVLEALDVGEDDDVIAFLDKAHGDAGDGGLDRHARVHERKGGAAGGSHRRGTVGLHDLGDHADRVGELVLGGDHGQKRALGEGAMADLAALRRAHAADFAGAVGREVVLVHVALALDRLDGVEALPLVEHAERADGKCLGLAALEEARAVDAGQVAGYDVQRADLVRAAAVGALAGLDDHLAHGLLLELLKRGGDIGAPACALFVRELVCGDLGLQILNFAHARELVGVLERCGHAIEVRLDALGDFGSRGMELVLHRRGVDLGDELGLLVAERRDRFLAEGHGSKHVLFRDFLRARFDHGDVVLGAGDGEVEVGVCVLLVGGVDDELASLGVAADLDAGGRAVEGGTADEERGRCAADADDVRLVFAVADERRCDDVDLVFVAVGETGADRTVDHTSV